VNAIDLYTTVGCHLCVQAEQLLATQKNITLSLIEIGDDDRLTARYGTSIPVLKFADNSELNWPFTQDDIEDKLAALALQP